MKCQICGRELKPAKTFYWLNSLIRIKVRDVTVCEECNLCLDNQMPDWWENSKKD